MFSGEDDTRLRTADPEETVFDRVEDVLSDLGDARVSDRGDIDILPRKAFENPFVQTTIRGRVRPRKAGEYDVVVKFTCTLTALGWVILVLGVLFALAGALILLMPMMKKDEIARRVRRTLRDLEDG